jgi:hypothetical protein
MNIPPGQYVAVRVTSVQVALEIAKVNNTLKPTTDDVIESAKKIEGYILSELPIKLPTSKGG